MPGILPQPDYARLAASLKEIAAQVEHIPNIPPPGDNRELTQMVTTLMTKVDTLTTKVDDLTNTVADFHAIQQQLALLPMQLKNASAGRSAPLHGPQGLITTPGPRTREELMAFTVANCMAAANHFGLPALPNATVIIRRQQIANYLGVSLD